jgi:Domain of unknown function (DUF4340)
MNARFVGILVVLLVVLGGGALLYQYQERSRRPDNAAALGRNLFKDLKAAEVAAVRIVEPKATLTVQQKNERWVLAERADFPADLGKVREFVVQALALKVGQSEPIGEKDRARLNLDDSGTRVEFLGADGKPLSRLIVGKKYFKREVDNPEKARADGRFVALPDEPKMVYIVSDPLNQATARSSEWIDKTSFQIEKVKTLEVRHAEGGGYRIERDGDNADWRLAGAKAGEKLDVGRANAASYSLSMLELADAAPKGSTLESPTTVQVTTLDGLSYTVRVGRLQGENYPVTFSAAGTLRKDAKDAERLKKLEERLPRDKLLSDYVLFIPKSKLEDTLKKRDELLEKRDEGKK